MVSQADHVRGSRLLPKARGMDLGTADKEGASLLQSCLVAFSWEEDHDKQAANYHVRPTKNIIGLYIQIIDKMLVIGPRVSCCLHLYLDGRIPPSTCLAWINKLHISLLEVQRRRAAVQEPATRSHRSQPRFAVVPLETVAGPRPAERARSAARPARSAFSEVIRRMPSRERSPVRSRRTRS